jgi:hypothetical protein
MVMSITKGNRSYIDDCEEALVSSELGIRYFLQLGSARSSLEHRHR